MRLDVKIGTATTEYPELTARAVIHMLEGVVLFNRAAIRSGELGSLYQSGARYQDEPPDYESLVDGVTAQRAGVGDCAHLAAWRVAELQEQGEDARLTIEWSDSIRDPSLRLYHVQVRRGDGSIEDPSAILGMGRVDPTYRQSGALEDKLVQAFSGLVIGCDCERDFG